jgi:hypothetical protein
MDPDPKIISKVGSGSILISYEGDKGNTDLFTIYHFLQDQEENIPM